MGQNSTNTPAGSRRDGRRAPGRSRRARDAREPQRRSAAGASRADWRRWAIMLGLAGRDRTARELHAWLEDHGWAVLSPDRGPEQVRRSLHSMCDDGHAAMVIRGADRPARFALSDLGREFVASFIADNPHITAEASQAAYP